MFGEEWLPPAAASSPEAPSPSTQRALYLRWRPLTFEDVVGQEHVTRTLRNAVVGGRLAHAYLFMGPRGTGKTSMARILYRAANCPNARDGEPCNQCPICVAALEGRSLDLVEIDAASNRGIDDMRELRERVAYRPSEGRYRVYIVDEAHELTPPAWDAFLKTLEEPPAHVIFVLATTEAHKVPATIVSRCQRFDFRRISYQDTRAQLARIADAEHLEVEGPVLDRLAHAARGGLRDALSLLDQLGAFGEGRVDMETARAVLGLPPAEAVQSIVRALGDRDAAGVLDQVAAVLDDGGDLRQLADELVTSLRAVLLLRHRAEGPLRGSLPEDELAWLREEAPRWTTGALMELIQTLSSALARTRDAQQLQIQIEVALLRACGDSAPGPGAGLPAAIREDAPPRATLAGPAPSESRHAPPAAPRPGRAGDRNGAEPPPTDTVPATAAPEGGAEPDLEGGAEPDAEMAPAAASEAVAAPSPDPFPVVAEVGPPEAADDLLGLVKRRWGDVLERTRERRKLGLASLLAGVQPLSLEGETLILGLTAEKRWSRRQLEQHSQRRQLEEILADVLGRPLRVRLAAEQGPSGEDAELLADPLVRYAQRRFGGIPQRLPEPETTAEADAGAAPDGTSESA